MNLKFLLSDSRFFTKKKRIFLTEDQQIELACLAYELGNNVKAAEKFGISEALVIIEIINNNNN